LSRFAGDVPIELFGLNTFPAIGAEPYFLTLGPHAFYWFQIRAPERHHEVLPTRGRRVARRLPPSAWADVLEGGDASALGAVLPEYITEQRWFQGKGRAIRDVRVRDVLSAVTDAHRLLLVDVQFVEEQTETYVVPVATLDGDDAGRFRAAHPRAVLAELEDGTILMDALFVAEFRAGLLDLIRGRRRVRGRDSELVGTGRVPKAADAAQSRLLGAEQSNTTMVFGRD